MANVDHKDGHTLHLRLIDPQDPQTASDPNASINTELVRDGNCFAFCCINAMISAPLTG